MSGWFARRMLLILGTMIVFFLLQMSATLCGVLHWETARLVLLALMFLPLLVLGGIILSAAREYRETFQEGDDNFPEN